MDSRCRIMKDSLKFYIDGANSEGPMIIHHILSIVNPMTRAGISNVKIKLGNIKMNIFDKNTSLANEEVKSWVEEIRRSNHQNDDIVLHIFQLYHSTPNPVFCEYIREKRNKWEEGEQIGWQSLLEFGLSKFNNLVYNTTWVKSDPLEAKFMALSTIASSAIEEVSKMNIFQK